MQSRRDWLKSSLGIGGILLAPSTLTAEEIIKFKDEKKLMLVGHSSKTGSETIEGKRINMEISISRAQTIKNKLINKGFDGNNIVAT